MLSEFERPMTDRERKRLLARLRPRRYEAAPSSLPGPRTIIVLIVVFLLVGLFTKPIIGGLSAAAYFLVDILPRYIKERVSAKSGDPAASRQRDAAKSAVLAASTVQVQRVESDTVVEVLGDLVTIYLFDLGDGRVFWHGVMPGDDVDPAVWPSRCFEIVHVSGSQETFGPFCEGARITPRETLEQLNLGNLPDTGIINLPLEQVLRRARKH